MTILYFLESILSVWILDHLEETCILDMNQGIQVLPAECHGLLQNIAQDKNLFFCETSVFASFAHSNIFSNVFHLFMHLIICLRPIPFVLGSLPPAAMSTSTPAVKRQATFSHCTKRTSNQKRPRFEAERREEGANCSSNSSLILSPSRHSPSHFVPLVSTTRRQATPLRATTIRRHSKPPDCWTDSAKPSAFPQIWD